MSGSGRREEGWKGLRKRLAAGLVAAWIGAIGGVGCAGRAGRSETNGLPTFTRTVEIGGRQYRYRVAGRDPKEGGTTVLATVVIPLALEMNAAKDAKGNLLELSAADDVKAVVESPIFQKYAFARGNTQYGDAVQRAAFYKDATGKDWHTLLGEPRVAPTLRIEIPAEDGYVLNSKRAGKRLAVVDRDYLEKRLIERLGKEGLRTKELAIAVTKDTVYYALGDATVCCAWGGHGAWRSANSNTFQAFVLGSYLNPDVAPNFDDVQALSEQIAEWMDDPMQGVEGNRFPAWLEPPENEMCGGSGVGSAYRFAEPTDAAPMRNTTVVTTQGRVYHLENAALPAWFAEDGRPGTFEGAYSFPDKHALTAPAQPCAELRQAAQEKPTATPTANPGIGKGHEMIGYWLGGSAAKELPLRDVSPQWDVVIVAFAPPAKGSTSVLEFHTPAGYTDDGFRADIRKLQREGRKVLISLGGGGQVVKLNTGEETREFVESVSRIVRAYGFNGVDLDLETPSLMLEPGDKDFRKPKTPAVVNLIAAMRELRRRFGARFMIAEVPEGPEAPAGMEVYAGQYGSFLPVIYGTRDILSFVDVQNYNTPPLEGLDGNYYWPDTADYYVAMTELLLRGFPVGKSEKLFFPPLPPEKVAIGFLVGRSRLTAIEESVRYLREGKRYVGGEYDLARPGGYRGFKGVMFWNIQADRRKNYRMSNAIGPVLHEFPRDHSGNVRERPGSYRRPRIRYKSERNRS